MYNKLFTKILDSSIWLAPDPHRLVWITLLAAMDEDGVVQFASVANVAARARVSKEDAAAAMLAFESPDQDSGDPENEGRRVERFPGGWLVLNASKYKALVTKVVAREKVRERVAKHRAKHAAVTLGNAEVTLANALVTPSETDTETQTQKETKKTPTPFPPDPPVEAASAAETPPSPRKRGKAPSALISCPEDVDPQVWADWIDLRKRKRAVVTPTTIQAARSEAAKGGMCFEAFLRVWCLRGSQGLQAEWLKPSERPGQSGETAYQRSMRERVEQATGGLVSSRLPGQPTTIMETFDVFARLVD